MRVDIDQFNAEVTDLRVGEIFNRFLKANCFDNSHRKIYQQTSKLMNKISAPREEELELQEILGLLFE